MSLLWKFAISVFSGIDDTGLNKENLSWEGEEFSFAYQFWSVLIISTCVLSALLAPAVVQVVNCDKLVTSHSP